MSEPASVDMFLHGEVGQGTFGHADHVRIAFELLRTHDFPSAHYQFATGLKTIAARKGNPGAYHETITLTFLSLIAERSAAGGFATFDDFIRSDPDVMDKAIPERWYSAERLRSDLARRIFILPEAAR